MRALLEKNGFEVVAVGGVTEALKCIAIQTFQVLITDLHMPNAGDGFTVISAMRHSQPAALTMLLSAFPDVKSAMEAIILEADEIVVKPVGSEATCGARPGKTPDSKISSTSKAERELDTQKLF
jgi:DNA-binding NtrC family response regulator